MIMYDEFDAIRPYHDEELPEVYEELIADPAFRKVAVAVFPDVPFERLAAKMRSCKTKLEFQKAFGYAIIKDIMQKASDGMTLDNASLADKTKAYTYLSNHRDIILDSGLLSVMLVDQGGDTVEIAIGDNLLIYPWIKRLVRINKSFIVQRDLPMRQMFESSARMSRYMHYTISQKKQSIWIAQREGRAKDSDDHTQDSVLKMLAIGGEGDVLDRLMEMNIAPLSISYEFDPCDFLKAWEFQLKRDHPDYKKSTADDLKNMQTGLLGYKGRVYFHIASCINDRLAALNRKMPRQELFSTVSAIIDREIHRGYRLYPCNYVAADLLADSDTYAEHYTAVDRQKFEDYLAGQLSRITSGDKDETFLRARMLEMYANPLKNYQKAMEV